VLQWLGSSFEVTLLGNVLVNQPSILKFRPRVFPGDKER
jgi:hypothetical protein